MRISFMGKGGSGKTTLTAAFTKYAAKQFTNVLAIDGDVNVHLSPALQMQALPLSNNEAEIFTYFEGMRNTPVISTTPPNNQSTFVLVDPNDSFLCRYSTRKDNINLVTVGTYEESDIGSSCYHGKLGVIEMLFHRLLDNKDDIVISDFTAGIDSLGTSMFHVSDINIFVVEPTSKGISVYKDFKEKSKKELMNTYVVINKVIDEKDIEFVLQHFDANEIIGVINFSQLLHRFERGEIEALDKFADEFSAVFSTILEKAQIINRDWTAYYNRLVTIYKASCKQWYNDYYSQNLETVIDSNFSYEAIIAQYT